MNRLGIIGAAVLLLVSAARAASPATQPSVRPEKKLIIFNAGKDLDWAHTLPSRLEKMQSDRPFVDGMVFHAGGGAGCPNFGFNWEKWTEQSLWFEDLKAINTRSTRFHENFLIYWAEADNIGPDFFDDPLWAGIIENAKVFSRAVKTAGARGIFFDPEYYAGDLSYSPWRYDHAGTKRKPPYIERGQSFDSVRAKARQRGSELMRAFQSAKPDIVLLTAFLYSGAWSNASEDLTTLPQSKYALLPAFADGMLEALNSTATIVDGNEESYYQDETRKYVEPGDHSDYGFARHASENALGAPELRNKWNRQGEAAMASYFDFCFNLYQPQPWRTAGYETKWWKHNVYNSLLTTDRYAWVYFEKFNFWTGAPAPSDADPVAGVREAVELYQAGKPLGYDLCKADELLQYQNEQPATLIERPHVTLRARPGLAADIAVMCVDAEPENDVTKVEFYVNSERCGETTRSPYEFTIERPAEGSTLFARMYTRDGGHCTSNPVTVHQGRLARTKTFR